MARKKRRFIVNTKFINTTFDKSKSAVSEGVAYSKLLVLSLAINLIVVVLVFVFKSFLPPQVPLLFGLAEGTDQLVNTTSLILPSLISIIIVLINTAMALIVTDDYLQKALVLTAFASSVIATIATLEIIFLVGSF
ncbi:hypothetical protein ACFL2C_01570 [Patescibacteria group bacterium]